jgi:gluconate 2-dehydrogenase gamma chain
MGRRSRREVLVRTALGFGGYLAVASGACKRDPAPAAAPAAPGLARSLSTRQRQIVEAACERLLPRDQDPGATDLGVAEYIDRALADADVRAQWGRAFFGGLQAIDRQAQQRYGKPFPESAPEQQDALLAAWQRSRFSGESRFFEILLTLTLEGAFSDPIHGGNRDGRGFLLVGFVPPPPMPGHHLLKLPKGT